jgi:broad specificity phosphatase PhoE
MHGTAYQRLFYRCSNADWFTTIVPEDWQVFDDRVAAALSVFGAEADEGQDVWFLAHADTYTKRQVNSYFA